MNKAGFTANQVATLSDRDSGIDKAIIRMNTSRIDASGKNRKKFRRRQPVSVTNLDTGLTTMAYVMGGQLARDEVAIDYDCRHALGLKFKDRSCQLMIKPAGKFMVIKHYITHADLGYRLSMQLGLLGASLGAYGVAKDIVAWMIG